MSISLWDRVNVGPHSLLGMSPLSKAKYLILEIVWRGELFRILAEESHRRSERCQLTKLWNDFLPWMLREDLVISLQDDMCVLFGSVNGHIKASRPLAWPQAPSFRIPRSRKQKSPLTHITGWWRFSKTLNELGCCCLFNRC